MCDKHMQKKPTKLPEKNKKNKTWFFLKYATKLLQELRSQEVGRNLKLNSRN